MAGITYLTFLPGAAGYRTRIRQCIALRQHIEQVILLFRSGDDTWTEPLPAGVSAKAIFGTAGDVHRGVLLRRLWHQIEAALHKAAPGDTLVVDDWFRFLTPLYPMLRLQRQFSDRRLLLLYSPVTSNVLWFAGSSWRDLWRCRDFSWHRGKLCPWELWSLLWADAVAVQSSGLAEAYERLGFRKKIIIVPNAVELPDSSPAPRPRRPGGPLRLLYVGNMTYNKGVDMILLLNRPEWHSRVEITLVGRGWRREGAKISRRLADTPFKVLPWQSAASLQALYRSHDLLLLPTLHEGMPRVVTEYLALDKPVVSTAVPGLSDIGSPLLFRFPRGDQTAFEAAILEAGAHSAASPEVVAANRAALAPFSIERTAAEKARQLRARAGNIH